MRCPIVITLICGTTVATAEYKKLPTQPAMPSSDTLPSGEKTPNNKVATGKGWRFQVADDAIAVDVGGGKVGYQFTSKGFDGKSYPIVMWATKEPFTGDLTALKKRESDAAKKAGAKVGAGGLVYDRSGLSIAGKYKNGSQRAEIELTDTTELRTVYVHNNAAYILHCETTNTPNAWRNVKSDCLGRSTSFHLEPK